MIARNKKIARERLVELANIIFRAKNASVAVAGTTDRLTKKKIREIINTNLCE